jgi:hypothetical protein
MAMLVADTYVLVGDHRQLSPVIQSLPMRETHLAPRSVACLAGLQSSGKAP